MTLEAQGEEMLLNRFCIFLLMFVLGSAVDAGQLRLLSGCNVDLNGDGQKDLALNIDTGNEARIMVFIKKGNSQELVFQEDKSKFIKVECRKGNSLKDIKGVKHKIVSGEYVYFNQVESSKSALIFNSNLKLEKIWLTK